MGLFGKKGNGRRVAEGGGGTLAAASLPTAASPSKSKTGDLELFGADSDESDDDATIERYAKDGGDEELDEKEAAEAEKRKVAVLNSKLSPEELFKKYDTDGSGNISASEFLAMLPDLGISISAAKAMRIFRKCDTDGGGAIDLTEFKMAMFAVDPVSGNLLGFSPSTLLGPRDAFELFDEDGTGKIDELEFADVLEYFGMDVSDEKQEKIFRKYDRDKSGYIDYQEFRSMWIKLVDVREELTKRGVEIPKHTRLVKVQQILETILDQEEAREAAALEQAKRFLQRQRDKKLREQLGQKAIIRAEDELAAALDAAGQVYIIGSGKYDQFIGDPVTRDEDLFPGFKAVSDIWFHRVNPTHQELQVIKPKAAATVNKQKNAADQGVDVTNKSALQQKNVKITDPQAGNQLSAPLASKYVRRRVENKRWKFQSPPRLNKQTISETKTHIRAIAHEMDTANDRSEGEQGADLKNSPTESSEVEEIPRDANNQDQDEEELAKLFFENREFVRSLRFRSTTLMTNTGPLWGKSVVQGAISDSVAFAVTSSGGVFSWGGRNSTWEASSRRLAGFDSDSDDDVDETGLKKDAMASETGMKIKITPRSALQKMCTPEQLKGLRDADVEAREEELVEMEARQKEETQRYERLKRVVLYYDVWEPPPSNATRLLFMEQVLLPKIEYDRLLTSAQLRGLEFQQITKMDLSLALGECFELEVEVKGEAGYVAFKELERLIKEYSQDKKSNQEKQVKLLQAEKDKKLQEWQDVKALRESRHAKYEEDAKARVVDKIKRADRAYESRAARRVVQLEDTIPEFTARGGNLRIEMSGITTRGPPLHSPRGLVAVASVSAGGSHVALVMQDGSLYTCGIGTSGRLGLQLIGGKTRCYDTNHPQRVEAFTNLSLRQVSCSFSHSAAIDSDGSLYTWGSACTGKLGVGIVEDEYKQYSLTPLLVKFPGKRTIRSVSCGPSHTGAVSTAGELFMWGSANGGRLGLGQHMNDTVVVPTLVRELVKKRIRVWQVSCGTAHSALCTEVTSECTGGSKKLLGGQVYVCGGATALSRFVLSWERIPELDDVGIRQVACGGSHTAAVSSYGELFTWGRNFHGCTGHDASRVFIEKPELLRCLHVEPYNLALGKPCRQINIYNEQGPHLAVNGETGGALATCIHTHMEDKPWWEVDLGQPAVIEKIRLWNRTDEPLNPSKNRSEYSNRLFPCWIFVSEFAFQDLDGNEGLRAAKIQSSAFELFRTNKRMTEWVLPTANTVGQFIRVQLQNKSFLHFAEVEVFGVYSAFKYVGKVGTVQCSTDATMVVMPPISTQSVLDDYYLRAVQADADHATILRQYDAYERSFRKFGRGTSETLDGPCRLCRVFRDCEVCQFYASANYNRRSLSSGEVKPLPVRLVGDRMGLKELVQVAMAEGTLVAEQQEQLRQEQEAADSAREAEAERQRAEEQERNKRQSRLLKPFQRLNFRNTKI
ncbi:Regulator of chromosome condensation (RCC1) repeat [Phytophthora infestans]|uniref:Regulator of chromosome condensation (RCC1) repeat n=1 Tax=Phytophthora infestans TaxID=4787 RepID=A0A8S9UL32_PHYIN|nr:Regulator of chromosome condensation (RCC1) repeat [Phytophthora infestans]